MEAFDIIIVAGQSNAEGCGLGLAKRPYAPDARVRVMRRDGFAVQVAEEMPRDGVPQGNFWLPFARAYVESGLLARDRGLLLVQAAVGGTGFSDKRWGLRDDLYLDMLAMTKAALALHPENELKALLWHQGETDAGTDEAAHRANLLGLARGAREAFDMPGLPFIAGDFVQHWKRKDEAARAPVIAAIRGVCGEVGGGFAETDGLESNDEATGNGDDIHFSREALHELGLRYFNIYTNLTQHKE